MRKSSRRLFFNSLTAAAIGLALLIPSIGNASMKMTSATQTCIGRFAISWPTQASLNIDTTFQNVSFKRDKSYASLEQLENQLNHEEKKLKNTSMRRDSYGDKVAQAYGLDPDAMYAKTRLVNYENQGNTILIGYHKDDENADIEVEAHRWISGKDYVFSSEGSSADQYGRLSHSLSSAADSFHPLRQNEHPKTSGFCTGNGIYEQSSSGQALSEEFTLVAHFPKHPGAKLIVYSRALAADARPEEPLKNRVDSQLRMIKDAGGDVSIMKRGDFQAISQDGYEVALAVHNDHSYKFFWSAQGENGVATRPALEINLTIEPSDGADTSFANDDAALDFWRSLLSSIQIRA